MYEIPLKINRTKQAQKIKGISYKNEKTKKKSKTANSPSILYTVKTARIRRHFRIVLDPAPVSRHFQVEFQTLSYSTPKILPVKLEI